MKKSEIVKKVDAFLATKEDFFGEITYYDGLADEIVEFIELSGMLPPTRKWNKSKFPGDINIVEENTWEEE